MRSLERKLAALCRAVALKQVEEKKNKNQLIIDVDMVGDILGAPIYDRDLNDRLGVTGVAVGLAWTTTGGEVSESALGKHLDSFVS